MSPAGGGDGGGDKPDKPDPFAPLPLASLPPVRRRGEPSPSIPPTAFVQTEPAPAEPLAPEPALFDAARYEPAPLGASEPPQPELGSGGQVWETPAGQAWTEAPAAQAWTEAPAAPAPEAPLLPEAYSENELRDAVGATPRAEPKVKAAKPPKRRAPTKPTTNDGSDDDDDDDDGTGKRRSRKTIAIAALSIFVGSGIAALVFLGKANSAKYFLACEADRVVALQGRSFPPWGSSALDGAEWQALKIPPETACQPRETENRGELAKWYLAMLVAFADKQLGAREITKVDDAEAALKQALLMTRSLASDEDAKNARAEIDRYLGDVVYWRASARLKGASDGLADAAKQFDAAALQRPQHFKDAAEWAKYTRTLIEQLRAGPGGIPAATFPPLPPSERPTAPPGVALPVEPEQGSNAGSAEPPPVAPDAGVPSGGVLL